MLIGLTGYAQSGKDTIAEYLATKGFRHLAFASELRILASKVNPTLHIEATEIALGYSPAQKIRLNALIKAVGYGKAKENPAVREFYQGLGQAMRDTEGEDYWIKKLASKFDPKQGNQVISDVRYENEIDFIKSNGGVVIGVERPSATKLNDHKSENELTRIDGTLKNSGTLEQLHEGIDFMLEYLGVKL